MSSQIYQPLPDAQNSIRLLQIEPGWPADQLRVSIIVIHDRSNAPPYDALSYVWGQELSVEPVLCDGVQISITANLASALCALRPLPSEGDPKQYGIEVIDSDHVLHSTNRAWNGFARNRNEQESIESRRTTIGAGDSITFLWVDALCINQDDLHERAAQVKQMRTIYSTASMVRIWLGTQLVTADGKPCVFPKLRRDAPPSIMDHSFLLKPLRIVLDFALKLPSVKMHLSELGHMPIILGFLSQALRIDSHLNTKPPSGTSADTGYKFYVHSAESGFPSAEAPEWDVLRAFFEQPWFYRVWIIQEILSAQNAIILMGDWEIDWQSFAKAVRVLDNAGAGVTISLGTPHVTVPDFFLGWQGISLHAAQYLCDMYGQETRHYDLLELLCTSRNRNATKPADFVFAILGISEEILNPNEDRNGILDLVTIDYTKSVADVFRDVTLFIMKSRRSLAPLYFAELSDETVIHNCPSWVPNWSQNEGPARLSEGILDASLTGFPDVLDFSEMLPKPGTDWEYNGETFSFQDQNVISVGGVKFERVLAVTPELNAPFNPVGGQDHKTLGRYPPGQEEIDFVVSAWKIAVSFQTSEEKQGNAACPNCHTGAELFTAFVNTLCGIFSQVCKHGNHISKGYGGLEESAKAWFDNYPDEFQCPSTHFSKVWNRFCGNLAPVAGIEFQVHLTQTSNTKRFFVTEGGNMGIGPKSMKLGDLVVIIFGLRYPFVLRESQTQSGKYMVIGPCYVDGLMEGQLIVDCAEKKVDAEMFGLV